MRFVRRSPALSFGLAMLLAGPTAFAQPSEAEIEAARQRGVAYLISQQQADGSWFYEKHEVGITALCTLALVENGVDPSDEVIRKGVEYVRDNTTGLTNTYDISLSIVLLSKIGSRKDKGRIRDLAAGLVAGQLDSGGWTYSCPKANRSMLTNPGLRPERKSGSGDNSCTQFAVLGLWVASREGVDIEEPMIGVAQRFVRFQNPDGGWSYRLPAGPPAAGADADPAAERVAPPEEGAEDEGRRGESGGEPSKNSMTFAGLFCLTVARATRIQAEKEGESRGRPVPTRTRTTPQPRQPQAQQPEAEPVVVDAGSEADTLLEDPIFSKGLEKAAAYAAGIRPGSPTYFLWSAERIGVMLGLEELGGTDWFDKSAAALLTTQAGHGGWPGGHGPLANTAFAILVLRKANLGSDITRLLEGEPEKPFEIVDGEQRFDTLAEALEAARAGDTIRVEGDGPFELPHVVVERDLTLQAGFGYQPVFRYDVGVDEFGIRARPEKDPEVRYMIKVTGGTLTLEGLKMEMDAPFTTEKLDWPGVVADGGNLRLLNCSITETNKRGLAAVVLKKPGNHAIVNCLLSASRAAVEVLGVDGQKLLIDNCVLFSDVALDLREDVQVQGEKRVELAIRESTIQAREALRLLTTPDCTVDVAFEGNVVKVAQLSPVFLAAPGKKDARSWTGGGNLYDVEGTWIGFRGRSDSSVTDLDSWRTYWGIEEQGSYDRIAAFNVRKTLGSFTHRLSPEDWELAESRIEAGVYPLTVGPGRGFSRFRSSIQYNWWQDGKVLVAEN